MVSHHKEKSYSDEGNLVVHKIVLMESVEISQGQ